MRRVNSALLVRIHDGWRARLQTIVKVGPFRRKGLSLTGEGVRVANAVGGEWQVSDSGPVAASRA